MLWRTGYQGRVTLIDHDEAAPYDRPNLSKDYLAGNAPEDWVPLRPAGFARAAHSRRAVVMGASFIGLEVAASLRARGLEVHVVAPDERPLVKVFGGELGAMVQEVHEEHGVVFHLRQSAAGIERGVVALRHGERLAADMVVVGIGVVPRFDLARAAGLTIDQGIVVNEFLQTSVPEVYAAGDIARWPDPRTREHIRVEHWVVA